MLPVRTGRDCGCVCVRAHACTEPHAVVVVVVVIFIFVVVVVVVVVVVIVVVVVAVLACLGQARPVCADDGDELRGRRGYGLHQPGGRRFHEGVEHGRERQVGTPATARTDAGWRVRRSVLTHPPDAS